MTGWVINPGGSPREVTMKQVISSSVVPDTLYMDAKVLMLVVPEVDVGSVVGFESVEEQIPEALEDSFAFQWEFPVVRSHYTLVLPPRWEPEFSWVNWAPLEPSSAIPRRSRPCPLSSSISRPSPKSLIGLEAALAAHLLVRITPLTPTRGPFLHRVGRHGEWYRS
jgi:hypothetical protein